VLEYFGWIFWNIRDNFFIFSLRACVCEHLYACTYVELTLRITGSPANGKTHGIPEMGQDIYLTYKVADIKILVVVVATNIFETIITRLSSLLCPYVQTDNGISTSNRYCRQQCNTFLPNVFRSRVLQPVDNAIFLIPNLFFFFQFVSSSMYLLWFRRIKGEQTWPCK
jgi:hypothetical protein